MIAAPSIFMLFLLAALTCVGISVLHRPRHKTTRIVLAGFAVMELLMAIGLALLVALPPEYF